MEAIIVLHVNVSQDWKEILLSDVNVLNVTQIMIVQMIKRVITNIA